MLACPDNPEALVERQWCLTGAWSGRDINVALARRAVALAPRRFEAVFNLASALLNNGEPLEALDWFNRSLALTDNKPMVHHHIGLTLHDLGRTTEALAAYAKAGDDVEVKRSIALADLTEGRLSQGLFSFEIEHHQTFDKPIFKSGIPRWRGEDLTGKTIIICHEQGFGDTIQFCRFLPQIKASHVLWSGPDILNRLIADNFSFDWIFNEEVTDSPFIADYYASPMSACAALGIEYADVSGAPYIKAPPMKLPERGLKVGLVWRGSRGYARDYERSARLEDFAPLFEIPGLSFYSLQYGEESSADIDDAGLTGFVADLGAQLEGPYDRARAIAAMDAVVSVDSSPAHLAGAMGKPLHLLLSHAPCWRWRHDDSRTPWYQSARIYKQARPGVWPVMNVKRALERTL